MHAGTLQEPFFGQVWPLSAYLVWPVSLSLSLYLSLSLSPLCSGCGWSSAVTYRIYWLGLFWIASVRSILVRSVLAWFGPVWSGLVGIVWFSVVSSGILVFPVSAWGISSLSGLAMSVWSAWTGLPPLFCLLWAGQFQIVV